jgi:SulP family sulfate permease
MIADTVAGMADGDAQRYAQIASLAAMMVALFCILAWLLRLSILVRLISDSILVGFKAGAGLTIAMTQLPSLIGVPGGGHSFFERMGLLAGQLGQIQYLVLALGVVAILLLIMGGRGPIAPYLVHCENVLDLELKRLQQCKTMIDLRSSVDQMTNCCFWQFE